MCSTRTVKSSYGEKSSIEDREILLIQAVKKVPTSKKKKVSHL